MQLASFCQPAIYLQWAYSKQTHAWGFIFLDKGTQFQI